VSTALFGPGADGQERRLSDRLALKQHGLANMQYRELKQPIEPPPRVAIARGLCSVAARLPPDINTERGCLEEAGEFLDRDPPNVHAALASLERAYAHAFRAFHLETRPEVWLVAAPVELLR